MTARQTRIAYLLSKYPAVSHTFILREVLGLRGQGFAIETASINAAPADTPLTADEKDEATRTFYVKAQGAGAAIRAAAWLLLHRPRALLHGARTAMALGRVNPARLPLCFFYLVEAAILVRWMHERALTHLHVHFASQPATVALLATYLGPITLSITVHGPDEFYDVPGFFLPAKMARARFVVCISFFARSQLLQVSGSRDWHKFHVARLGVDTSLFRPSPFRPAPETFEILCVGRLVPTKGQRILIDALGHLVRAGRPVRLTLVGGGPERGSLEQHAARQGLAEHVTFTGAVNQDAIQTLYAAADIFALASFAEGIPVVLMEAMALEIPCVATAINGIPELIRNEVDGLLVAPSDAEGMAAAIARLMDDSKLRRTLGSAGRQRVRKEYELARSIDRLAAVFCRELDPAQETP